VTRSTVLIVISLVIAIGRFTIPGHGPSWPGTYEAFSHIWVGALIVLCFTDDGSQDQYRRLASIGCLVAISAFELLMFLLR
jgi:hypothetical protein